MKHFSFILFGNLLSKQLRYISEWGIYTLPGLTGLAVEKTPKIKWKFSAAGSIFDNFIHLR